MHPFHPMHRPLAERSGYFCCVFGGEGGWIGPGTGGGCGNLQAVRLSANTSGIQRQAAGSFTKGSERCGGDVVEFGGVAESWFRSGDSGSFGEDAHGEWPARESPFDVRLRE